MIDFWELTGRLLLMDKAKRKKDIYDPGGLLPLQSDGCILLGHATSPRLPFTHLEFYKPLRDHFLGLYQGKMMSPVLSMYALGEIGILFFNQPFRNGFETLSDYLKTQASGISDRTDTNSDPAFYMALTVIALDTNVRETVKKDGDFQGLPVKGPDSLLLVKLAGDPVFRSKADLWSFGIELDTVEVKPPEPSPWGDASQETLNIQTYPPKQKVGAPVPRKFTHVCLFNLP